MPHHRFGPDLSFFDKKMQACFHAHSPGLLCEEKQTAGAEIENLRSIVIPVGAPADIDAPGGAYTRAGPSRMGSWLLDHGSNQQMMLIHPFLERNAALGGINRHCIRELIPTSSLKCAPHKMMKG
jgi:hypothetical protein